MSKKIHFKLLTILLLSLNLVFSLQAKTTFPCLEVCEINKQSCQNQANSGYNGCHGTVEQNASVCAQTAEAEAQGCITNSPPWMQYICNQNLNTDLAGCDSNRYSEEQYCQQQLETETTYCTNDYENCVFACQQ
jgi:hypothetical protein